jgi:hypothetical protein
MTGARRQQGAEQMNWRTIAFIALMVLCWSNVPSNAAEVSCPQLYTGEEKAPADWTARFDWGAKTMPVSYATCIGGFLRGQISKGDYEKVATFLKAHLPFVSNFSLASPGGDVDEALKIGRLFRKYLIATVAPVNEHFEATGLVHDDVPFLSSGSRDLCRGQDCICASACALIWMGGTFRTGTVGLHRPRIVDPIYKGLPASHDRVEVHLNLSRSPLARGMIFYFWARMARAAQVPGSRLFNYITLALRAHPRAIEMCTVRHLQELNS